MIVPGTPLLSHRRVTIPCVTRYVRYSTPSGLSSGILDGDTVREIRGTLFDDPAPTGVTHNLSAVKLLAPIEPGKILAVGRNYKSHLGTRPQPPQPEVFYKPISCLQDPEGPIVIPGDSIDLHYEAELVLVIGKRVRRASKDEAQAAIFGVTCGNEGICRLTHPRCSDFVYGG